MKHMNTIKKYLAVSMAILFSLSILLSMAGSATVQASRDTSGSDVLPLPSQPKGLTDRAELETFLDELFGKEMQEHHIAGAAISVVKDGRLFFAKGYGYANLDKRIPVDPEQTIFRTGSIGKLFTWTAVMQLVEQGKLDLDADINTYLDFRIPDTYPQPITLKHLMTHTSGFEDRWFGSAVTDASEQIPAREWLVTNMWARVRPPGVAGYSNFNAMLAGYIVARVSGQPYEQYIQEHILDPLGMTHSTAQSPIPLDLHDLASVGYTYVDGVFQVFPDYIGQPALAPSGIIQASATDMARFMIAHLQGGRYSDASIAEAQILKETTARQMQNTLYTPDPRLLGTAYGFFDWTDNGQRTLGHTGYSPPMNSVLFILPDQNLGVFVTCNSKDVGDLTLQHLGFQRAFFDHYYPAPASAPLSPPADFAKRAGRFVGTYNAIRSYATAAKILGLFGEGYTAEISDSGDGALLFSFLGLKWRFVEIEPLYFRQVGGPFTLVFREDDRGNITHMFTDLMPEYALEKLGWYETPGFNRVLALSSILILLSMIPVAAIRLIRSRRLSGDRELASRGAELAYWIILGVSILNLLFLACMGWGVMFGTENEMLEPVLIIKIALGLGVLSAVLTAVALVFTVLAWKNRYFRIASRAYYSILTISAVAFIWFMNYWNLLGWRY